jgi:hypothetical protein
LINIGVCAQQSSSRILGTITSSESGEFLIGVNVLLYADSLKTAAPVKGTASSNKGYYELTGLAAGEYWLFASSLGYETLTEKIIIPGDNITVEFSFSLKATELELDQVLIEARRDTFKTISTIQISPEFLKQLPSMSGEIDVFKALTLLPGVTTASELSSGLYIRGGSPDQTLTLIDGVPVYNPFHLGGLASTFNSDAINDIRLIKGAYPAQYGGRLSSVLDIALKEGSKERFYGTAGIGTLSSRLTLEGPISDNASYFISGRKLYMDLLVKEIVPDKNFPLYNFYDINGKFDYKITAKDKIILSGYTGEDNLYSPEKSEDAGYDINWGNTTLNFSWLHLFEEQKFTNVSLMFTGFNFNTLIIDKNADAFRNDFYSESRIDDYGLKIDGQYFSTEKHTVKNGIEVTLHNFFLVNNNFFSSAVQADERIGSRFNQTEIAAYVQDQWQITPVLSANIGLRGYYLPESRYISPEPRISTVYALTHWFFVKGAFSVTNQFLHLITRNDVVLPTDIWFPSTTKIKPSRSTQGVLGFEAEFNDREYFITAEGYYRDMENLYEYSDNAVFTIEAPTEDQLTQGRGEAYGLELFFNKRKGNFTGWVGYTLSWTRRFFDSINRGKPFYPRYDKRHDVSAVLTYRLSDTWEFGATWSYGTGQAYTMPIGQYYFPGVYSSNQGSPQVFLDYTHINEYRLPPFHKLDISATYKFILSGLKAQLNTSIYNVYNRQNPFARYVNFEADGNVFANPLLKQFTLFPFFPSVSLTLTF